MKKLTSIKTYQNNFDLYYEDKDGFSGCISLSFDGEKGIFTADEWAEDPIIAKFNKEDQEKIIELLEVNQIIKEK